MAPPPTVLPYKDLKPFLEDPASERHWDDLYRTAWFQLREGEALRTAWFDDARSLREKSSWCNESITCADTPPGAWAWKTRILGERGE